MQINKSRTILECKAKIERPNTRYGSCIRVEPYWNVKEEVTKKICSDFGIRVEPYWNVKIEEDYPQLGFEVIRVEPYWNVNHSTNKEV